MQEASRGQIAFRVHKDASPTEATRFCAPYLSRWSGWSLDDVAPANDAMWAFVCAVHRYQRAREDSDPSAPHIAARLHRIGVAGRLDRVSERRDQAVELLDPVIGAGLIVREGSIIKPRAVLPGREAEMAADWLAWKTLEMLLGLLGASPCGRLRVCESCTNVYRTRRSDSRSCDLCRDQRPKGGVLGLDVPWPSKRGDKVKTRVPVIFGNTVVGWKAATVGISRESGQPFHGTKSNKQGLKLDRNRRGRRI